MAFIPLRFFALVFDSMMKQQQEIWTDLIGAASADVQDASEQVIYSARSL